MKQQNLKIKRKTLFVFKAKKNGEVKFNSDPTTAMTTMGTRTVPI